MSGRSRGRRGRPHPYSDGPDGHSKANARQALEDGDGRLIPFRRGVDIDAGDLSGETVEPIQASFTYFGKRFRVNPNLTETMVIDLLESGEDIDDPEDPRQLVAVKDYVRDHLHPEDFDGFWQTAINNRQGVRQVVKVCWVLLERITDRPTTPPSDSSDGRRDTPTSSLAGASVPATENLPAATPEVPAGRDMQAVADHFIRKFNQEGRPDKALQIALAAESRSARGLVTV